MSVFQPHRYSRLMRLKTEFASSFKSCDAVVLCPVYSAGEKVKYDFNQNDFSKLISKKSFIYSFLTSVRQKINDPFQNRKKRR